MPDKDACRRWTVAIAQLRARAVKVRRPALSPEVTDLLDQAFTTCDGVVRDLAGSALDFDAHTVKLNTQTALWGHLFDEMPVACLETDATGVIVNANREAAMMLNTSAKHLGARLLMHFAEDREQFGRLLRGLPRDGDRQRAQLVIRPRERAPFAVDVTVAPRIPGDPTSWIWFFQPAERALVNGRRVDKRAAQTLTAAAS